MEMVFLVCTNHCNNGKTWIIVQIQPIFYMDFLGLSFKQKLEATMGL